MRSLLQKLKNYINGLIRLPDLIIPPEEGYPEERIPQYTQLYCILMTIIDIRFWFCKCGYTYPYGLCFLLDCKLHNKWIRKIKEQHDDTT